MAQQTGRQNKLPKAYGYTDQKAVGSEVEMVLNENLPESYDRILFREKCDNVFEMMLDYAGSGQKWAAA